MAGASESEPVWFELARLAPDIGGMKRVSKRILCAIALAGLTGLMATPAMSDGRTETAWVDGPEGKVRLVAGRGAEGQRWLGLSFVLRPGWKVFWRSPGAPGLPPVLSWAGSQNLKAARIVWPAPEVFTSFGFKARGYGGNITLPIAVTAQNAVRPVNARLFVRYQVCKDVCIPGDARLSLVLGRGGKQHPAIAGSLARVPRPAGQDFAVWQAMLKGGAVIVRIRARKLRLAAPVVLIEAPRAARLGRSQTTMTSGGAGVRTVIGLTPQSKAATLSSLRITLIDGGRSWEKTVPVRRSVRR